MRLLRTVAVFLTAIAILAAGILLPDLLLERSMNSHVDDVEYVRKDELHPYGENFFEVQQNLLSMSSHREEVIQTIYENPEYNGDVAIDDMTPIAADADTYDSGYAGFMNFVGNWNKDLYADILPENGVMQSMVYGETWELCYAQFYNPDTENFIAVVYDPLTGLPVDIEITIRYVSTLRIEKFWTGFLETYSSETGMEFTRDSFQTASFNNEYSLSSTAHNFDGSVSLNCDASLEEGVGYIIHFYLK